MLTFIFFGCGMNTNKTLRLTDNVSSGQDFKALAIEKLGANFKLLPSPDESYVLYRSARSEQSMNPNELVAFFVVDKKANKIVYEDAIAGVSLSWKSDNELWIKTQKGNITSADDSGKLWYYYDLKKKEKIEYNKEQQY